MSELKLRPPKEKLKAPASALPYALGKKAAATKDLKKKSSHSVGREGAPYQKEFLRQLLAARAYLGTE